MRVSQIAQLRKIGYTLSDNFKTSGTYGLQPIMLSSFSYRLVFIYIDHVRGLISPRNNNNNNNWESNDFLWLNYNGDRQLGIGNLITKYFRKKIKVNVTTTCFRSLYETESDTLYDNGVISASERASIRQINGHSSATVKQYYLKKNISQDVDNARSVLKSLPTTNNVILLLLLLLLSLLLLYYYY
jgi:hypothetical protein